MGADVEHHFHHNDIAGASWSGADAVDELHHNDCCRSDDRTGYTNGSFLDHDDSRGYKAQASQGKNHDVDADDDLDDPAVINTVR